MRRATGHPRAMLGIGGDEPLTLEAALGRGLSSQRTRNNAICRMATWRSESGSETFDKAHERFLI